MALQDLSGPRPMASRRGCQATLRTGSRWLDLFPQVRCHDQTHTMVTFGDFSVQFIIDEDLVNYNSIQKWIRRNGNDGADSTIVPGEPEYSNGRLLITTSNYQVKKAIVFKGLFPISITSVPFDATVTDQEYFTANVVFKYHNYMITDTNFNEL